MPDSTVVFSFPDEVLDENFPVVVPSIEAVIRAENGLEVMRELLKSSSTLIFATSTKFEALTELDRFFNSLADDSEATVSVSWFELNDLDQFELCSYKEHTPNDVVTETERTIQVFAFGAEFWTNRTTALARSMTSSWNRIFRDALSFRAPDDDDVVARIKRSQLDDEQDDLSLLDFEHQPDDMGRLLKELLKLNQATPGFVLASSQVSRLSWRLVA